MLDMLEHSVADEDDERVTSKEREKWKPEAPAEAVCTLRLLEFIV